MSRTAYVNGRYVPHSAAVTHIEDRGYQFADGVYEVCGVDQALLLDEEPHLDRLERSLRELRIKMPVSRSVLSFVIREVIRRNNLRQGLIYIQITRGVAPRDHPFPSNDLAPTLVLTARRQDFAAMDKMAEKGVAVKTVRDIRWGRCDIKSVSLLPNILAKQEAREAGAYEAWFVDEEGWITEGSSTTAWIVDGQGNLITRQLDEAILPGITRRLLINIAREEGFTTVERAFTLEEVKRAREAFMTAATMFVMPVIRIDDSFIAGGKPGFLAGRLRSRYRTVALSGARE